MHTYNSYHSLLLLLLCACLKHRISLPPKNAQNRYCYAMPCHAAGEKKRSKILKIKIKPFKWKRKEGREGREKNIG